MRVSRIWGFLGDNILSLTTILLAIVVISLEQIGFLSEKVVPPTILAVVTLLATSEIVENRRKISKIEEDIKNISDQISEATHGVQVLTFLTSDEAHEYAKRRTKEASISIDQASIDYHRSKPSSARKDYEKARKEVILSDRLNYRYIGLLDTPRRLEQSLEFVTIRKLYRYFAGFYLKPSPEMPLISFVVFDKKEVFTRYPYEVGQEPGYIAIRSPHTARLFLGYFERLWEASIKVENKEDYARLSQLLASQRK